MDDFEYDYKLLKETRLTQGISTDSIAFDLCLAERQILFIENNSLEYFYSPAIKLTCVKKYAEKLGLDIEAVLNKKEGVKVSEVIPPKVEDISLHKNRVPTHLQNETVNPGLKKAAARAPLKKDRSSHAIIQLSVAYIQEHLANKITMHDLKKLTSYSERSLQLVFKSHFNQTPFEYIEEQRLLKARALIELHKQSKKIAAIAQDAGFTHLGRFSVNFKKRFGMSPSLFGKA